MTTLEKLIALSKRFVITLSSCSTGIFKKPYIACDAGSEGIVIVKQAKTLEEAIEAAYAIYNPLI